MALTEDQNGIPVRLVHEYQVIGLDNLFDLLNICAYILGPVTHCVTGIQAVKRRITYSTVPGKNGMNKLLVQGKVWIPEVCDLFSDPQKISQIWHVHFVKDEQEGIDWREFFRNPWPCILIRAMIEKFSPPGDKR